jgi:Glycosyl transferase family 2
MITLSEKESIMQVLEESTSSAPSRFHYQRWGTCIFVMTILALVQWQSQSSIMSRYNYNCQKIMRLADPVKVIVAEEYELVQSNLPVSIHNTENLVFDEIILKEATKTTNETVVFNLVQSELSTTANTSEDFEIEAVIPIENPITIFDEVIRRADPITTNGTVVSCSIMTLAAKYIDEWADYYLGLGFAYLYIYDNTDDFELEEWGRKRQEVGQNNIQVIHYPGPSPQFEAYHECAEMAIEQQHTWVFFQDFDEFLVLLKDDLHIADFANKYAETGSVGIPWQIFGSSGQEVYEHIPVTKRFQYRVENNYPTAEYIKLIIRLDDLEMGVKFDSPHTFQLKEGKSQKMLSGQQFWGPTMNDPRDVAVINHYYFKSYEEYITKHARGSSVYGQVDEMLNQAIAHIGLDGLPIPNGTIFDDTAWKALKRMVPKYALYDDA